MVGPQQPPETGHHLGVTDAATGVLTLDSFSIRNIPEADRAMAENVMLAVLETGVDWDAFLADLTEDQARSLEYDWDFWGRPDQFEPVEFTVGTKRVWVLLAGRGFGKTKTGAETIRRRVKAGKTRRNGIVAPTAGDARDVMIEGETGILSVCPAWERPHYEPSKRRLTWPNGSITHVYSADEPDRLRGPQHDFLWGDEPASWRYGEEALDQMEFGLRLGRTPQMMLTGTPRPLPWLKKLLEDEETVVTGGSSYRNLANLAASYIRRILKRYEGTRLGLQELHAQVLEDIEGALWTHRLIDAHRLKWTETPSGLILPVPDLDVTVVAVDPTVEDEPGDECGIVVLGRDGSRDEGHVYVTADRSMQGGPHEWATAVCRAAEDYDADYVVAEKNNGGALVRQNIHMVNPRLKVVLVSASKGKKPRAQPVATAYEGGRVHHVGTLPDLETQQCEWVPGETKTSPDRVDALVWGVTELIGLTDKKKVRIIA